MSNNAKDPSGNEQRENLEPETPRVNPYEGWLGFGKDRVQTGRSVALVIFAVVMIIGVAQSLLGDKFPLANFLGSFSEGKSSAQTAPDKTAKVGTAKTANPTGTALSALEDLKVKDKDPFNDFNRNRLFGEGWLDLDGDDCNTRNEVLARDLENVEFRKVTPRNCVVQSGTLKDDYTGKTIQFLREKGSSDKVQIDHVVALGNVWRTGGQHLDQETRKKIANDPLNLIAVDGETNQDKESQDASDWLPPNEAFHCEYVARQIAVKTKYGLWVTPEEKKAMSEVLAGCPDEPLPGE